MDNSQMPPVQPTQDAMNRPMVQQVQAIPQNTKDTLGLIKTVVIIILSLVSVTFIGLFVWMFLQYDEVRTDVEGQINVAVAAAKDEQAQKDEEEFLEREKYPYKTFSGPADYGELTFQYPKTWSVYVAADAASGGDFNAYLNPIQVEAVAKDTINALRVTIRNKSYDDVAAEYQKLLEKKDANLTVETITTEEGVTMNRYAGTIPGTDLNGYVVIFKIRDKTAILQTDSVVFGEDFDKLIQTVTFNA